MSKSLCLQPNNLAETFLNLDAIRQLIREELGCDCPEEVFDRIVVGYPSIFGSPNIPSSAQVLVGYRLLVSLVPVHDLQDVAEDGKQFLVEGKDIRDANGLNRYRLVFVGHVSKDVMDELQKQAVAMDDRMHVHLIEPDRPLKDTAPKQPV
jgi:hypothetical protein